MKMHKISIQCKSIKNMKTRDRNRLYVTAIKN